MVEPTHFSAYFGAEVISVMEKFNSVCFDIYPPLPIGYNHFVVISMLCMISYYLSKHGMGLQ